VAVSSRIAGPMLVATILLGTGTLAHADSITIVPTFDSSITSLADAASVEGAINAAIGAIEGYITSPNNITVSIDFQSMTSGLGESATSIYNVSYYSYYNALEAVATSPTQLPR
jgi:hypothetical protein